VSTQVRFQSDPFEKLKTTLADVPRGYDFLAGYVRELELFRKEEDVFRRLAFRNVSSGGSHRGSSLFVVSVFSELYEPLDAERKLEIRKWWDEKVRGEANQFDDLRTRLSRLIQ
jgi:hypothetical protein